MSLAAIAYVSDVAGSLPAKSLDVLVDDAVRFNSVAGVTGVLLFDGARFLQYFEGPADGAAAVYERVRQARSHRNIIELGQVQVPQRYFPFWSMRWLGVEPALIEQLSASDWHGFAERVDDVGAVDSAMERLLRHVAPHVPRRGLDAPSAAD